MTMYNSGKTSTFSYHSTVIDTLCEECKKNGKTVIVCIMVENECSFLSVLSKLLFAKSVKRVGKLILST